MFSLQLALFSGLPGSTQHCEGDVDVTDRNYVDAHLGCTTGVGDAACEAADADWNAVVNNGDKSYVQARYGTCPTVNHEEYYYDGLRRVQDIFELDDSTPTRITEREYIYGPDDLDEILLQIDRNNKVMYSVLDANLNVVAILNHSAVPLEQTTYDAYGQVLTVEQFHNHPANRIGHQGLFFERLFANPSSTPAGTPVLTPGAQGFTPLRKPHD